jgi:hypothetical protein
MQNGAIATSDREVECEFFFKTKAIAGRLIKFNFETREHRFGNFKRYSKSRIACDSAAPYKKSQTLLEF